MSASIKSSSEENSPQKEPTLWLALTENVKTYNILSTAQGWRYIAPVNVEPWTDRFSSIIAQLY